jgi:hemerythrin
MVQWSDKFTTGSDTLDYQHQTLIDNINQLEKLLLLSHPTREDYEYIIQMVDFLEFYAHAHFKTEEQCMEAFRCPAHAQNKQAHADFMRFFSEFKTHNRAKGFPREIVEELHAVASRWIVEHILQVDTQLRPCMKG